jgi:hypothetical protein
MYNQKLWFFNPLKIKVMKHLYFILFLVFLVVSCGKEELDILPSSSSNSITELSNEGETTISNELMKLLSTHDTIPIEVLQEYSTENLIEVGSNQRTSCTTSWGQTCHGVVFTAYPNFAYVLNWTVCDTHEELLYFSPHDACVTSSLPSQSIIGSFNIIVDFGNGIISIFKVYRFVPALAGMGEYRVIVKHDCTCSSEIRIGFKIHECGWVPIDPDPVVGGG